MTTMARPRNRPKGRPKGEKVKKSIASIKGTDEFREWLDGLSKHTHLPYAILIELALRRYAVEEGYDTPAPER